MFGSRTDLPSRRGAIYGILELSIERLSFATRRRLVAVAGVVTALCLVLRLQYAFGGTLNHLLNKFRPAFSAYELGPLRLLNFAAFGLIVYWASQRFRSDQIHARAYSWLAFIRRHSLPVFAWSILGTYAVIAFLPLHLRLGVGLFAVVLLTASLTVPAQLHAMIRKQRATLVAGRRRVDELATTPATASGDVAG
jgi:hypothetical protein